MIFAWPLKLSEAAQMSLADTAATASPLTVLDVTRHGHIRTAACAAACAAPFWPATGKMATVIVAATTAYRIGIFMATTHRSSKEPNRPLPP